MRTKQAGGRRANPLQWVLHGLAPYSFAALLALTLSACGGPPPVVAGSCSLNLPPDVSDDDAISAVVHAEGYRPAAEGTVVYLHLDDIRPALERVPKAGGKVLLSLTELPNGGGVFAQLRDSEGNRVGLYSRA